MDVDKDMDMDVDMDVYMDMEMVKNTNIRLTFVAYRKRTENKSGGGIL
jgi:hypothetical protein